MPGLDPANRLGILPWATDPFELQHRSFIDSFPATFFDFSGRYRTKVVHPASISQNQTRLQQLERLHELERTMTTFLNYFAALGKYKYVYWLGADNVAVTMTYFHQLVIKIGINMLDHRGLRSHKEVVNELYRKVASACSQGERALFVFSNAERLEADGKSKLRSVNWTQIQPFLPDNFAHIQYGCIDLLILTLNPDNFLSLPSAVKIPCVLRSKYIKTSSEGTLETYSKLVKKYESKKEDIDDIDDVLILLALLYPNNVSDVFLETAIDGVAKGTRTKSAERLKAALTKLQDAFVVRRLNTGNSFCIDRRFLEHFKTTAQPHKLKWMVGRLIQVFNENKSGFELSNRKAPMSQLFFGSKGQPSVVEAATHQAWFATVAAPGETSNFSLVDCVSEYINLTFVGSRIGVFEKRKLGSGMNPVFEGYIYDSTAGKRQVAVKRVSDDTIDWDRLSEGMNILDSISSDYVVKFECSERSSSGGLTYVAMELCDKSLEHWVLVQGQKDLTQDLENLALRAKFLKDAAKGLEYLKRKNIVHRDIKPDNILLKTDGGTTVAKITDFDFCKNIGDGQAKHSRTCGTLGYLAPEVRTGNVADYPSDMFSFGHACYFVLSCGKRLWEPLEDAAKWDFPFDFYGIVETIKALVSEEPSDRPIIEDLLEYPIFWVASAKEREKFTKFFVNLGIQYADKPETTFYEAMKKIKVDWETALETAYAGFGVKKVIDYYYRRRPEREFFLSDFSLDRRISIKDAAGYLRFCFYALVHLKDHTEAANQGFADEKYFDKQNMKLDYWKFFQTYFSPTPELAKLFFKVWSIASYPVFSIPVDALSTKDYEPMEIDQRTSINEQYRFKHLASVISVLKNLNPYS